jgi:hypothetical protein
MNEFRIVHKGVEVEIPNRLIEAIARWSEAAVAASKARYPATRQTFERNMNSRFQNELMPELESTIREVIDQCLRQKS